LLQAIMAAKALTQKAGDAGEDGVQHLARA
jgi:hypothetical protein